MIQAQFLSLFLYALIFLWYIPHPHKTLLGALGVNWPVIRIKLVVTFFKRFISLFNSRPNEYFKYYFSFPYCIIKMTTSPQVQKEQTFFTICSARIKWYHGFYSSAKTLAIYINLCESFVSSFWSTNLTVTRSLNREGLANYASCYNFHPVLYC